MTDFIGDVQKVNLTSLKLVHDELLATIEQAAARLEQFAAARDDGELLQQCNDGIRQISGTLSLVQLRGADLLADELLALINEMTLGESEETDNRLSLLTSTFFILPRYVEYVLQTGRGLPPLLIPHINELRAARRQPLLSEAHFFSIDETAQRPDGGQGSAVFGEDLTAFVRRFRHMYQVALLNVIKAKQVRPSLGMMQRAMVRLSTICGVRPIANLWWAASVALQAMADSNLELNKERKMLLGALDRQIKQLQAAGTKGLDTVADPSLLRELVYLSALSGSETEQTQSLLSTFKAPKLSYTDAALKREMESLRGPSANTLSSMAAVLQDELRAGKDVLERASEGGTLTPEDSGKLLENLQRVADILSVVGLSAAGNSLKQELTKVAAWQQGKEAPDTKDMVDLADALLYVESTIASIDKLNLSDEKLAEVNSLARRDVIANNQLAEAEALVFEEAESGLALVKRALNSFSESDYDRAHIKNVGSTLNAVRGGMMVVGLNRAASVVHSCAEFVENSLLKSDQPAALQQLLETFADAVISLEYYLDAAQADKSTDESVLEIAEESLAALGYPVAR